MMNIIILLVLVIIIKSENLKLIFCRETE